VLRESRAAIRNASFGMDSCALATVVGAVP
jgi:hypothetical protein